MRRFNSHISYFESEMTLSSKMRLYLFVFAILFISCEVNSSTSSQRVVFNVNNYGAKADGKTDNSKVMDWTESLWASVCFCFLMFWFVNNYTADDEFVNLCRPLQLRGLQLVRAVKHPLFMCPRENICLIQLLSHGLVKTIIWPFR